MNIDSLKHIGDFNIKTKSIGEIRIGPSQNEIEKIYDENSEIDKINNNELSRKIISKIGRKLTGNESVDKVCGGPELSDIEISKIDSGELEDFSSQFISRRLKTTPEPSEIDDKEDELIKDFSLGIAIIKNLADQRAMLKRIVGSITDSMNVGAIAAKMNLQTSALDTIKSIEAGHVGILQKAMLQQTSVGAALKTIKAFGNLGETLAAVRASDEKSKMVENSPIPYASLIYQKNPILETNELIKKNQDYAEKMRPVFIRSAELIQTLTDTTLSAQALANANSQQAEKNAEQAEKNSEKSMKIAITSIYISIFIGAMSIIAAGVSIYYARLSPTSEQADQLSRSIGENIEKMSEISHKDNMDLKTEKSLTEEKYMNENANVNSRIIKLERKLKIIKNKEN